MGRTKRARLCVAAAPFASETAAEEEEEVGPSPVLGRRLAPERGRCPWRELAERGRRPLLTLEVAGGPRLPGRAIAGEVDLLPIDGRRALTLPPLLSLLNGRDPGPWLRGRDILLLPLALLYGLAFPAEAPPMAKASKRLSWALELPLARFFVLPCPPPCPRPRPRRGGSTARGKGGAGFCDATAPGPYPPW